ncbi:uncharacterized protein LOC143260811 isoform X2 [Megalopta genalis]|uniref:uncharacterized protein LOC143260811 isoform X2 n=1 Tax=Megalopta genalis TaxID=115081 RepID=UPI003FD08766
MDTEVKSDFTTNSRRRQSFLSDEMDVFRKNFSTYCSVLCFAGLWPYADSKLEKIRRIGFCLLILCCIGTQIRSLKSVELSLYNILLLLSYTCPMLLYFLRYVGFLLNLQPIKDTFRTIENDWITIKDPVEVCLIMKHVAQGRRVVLAFVVLSSILAVFISVIILVPTVLRLKYQLRYLRMFGFFYDKGSHETDLVSVQLVVVSAMGMMSIAATESTLTVLISYMCGMLDIISYRMETAIQNAIQSGSREPLNVQPAIELHQRSLQMTVSLTDDMMISYLVAIVAVIISFAVNLYRFLLATNNMDDFENLFFSGNILLLHFVIMFLNNYSGQRLINTGVHIFDKICNSLWYALPVKSQKLLLFILMRSIKEVRCDLAGLYTPSYEGFSMMMSSSFSYFTVIYSTQ